MFVDGDDGRDIFLHCEIVPEIFEERIFVIFFQPYDKNRNAVSFKPKI